MASSFKLEMHSNSQVWEVRHDRDSTRRGDEVSKYSRKRSFRTPREQRAASFLSPIPIPLHYITLHSTPQQGRRCTRSWLAATRVASSVLPLGLCRPPPPRTRGPGLVAVRSPLPCTPPPQCFERQFIRKSKDGNLPTIETTGLCGVETILRVYCGSGRAKRVSVFPAGHLHRTRCGRGRGCTQQVRRSVALKAKMPVKDVELKLVRGGSDSDDGGGEISVGSRTAGYGSGSELRSVEALDRSNSRRLGDLGLR